MNQPPSGSNTSTAGNNHGVYPLYDAFLDVAHPAASTSSEVNMKRVIIAPPRDAFHLSKDVGVELSTENGIQRVVAFCFPDYYMDANLKREFNSDKYLEICMMQNNNNSYKKLYLLKKIYFICFSFISCFFIIYIIYQYQKQHKHHLDSQNMTLRFKTSTFQVDSLDHHIIHLS